jgi:penicillin-binding protein 1B
MIGLGLLGLVLLDIRPGANGLSLSGAHRGAPSRVYARPLVLEVGQDIDRIGLAEHLARIGYGETRAVPRAGEYARTPDSLRIHLRPSLEPGAEQAGRVLEIRLRRGSRISRIRGPDGRRLARTRIEPELLGVLHGSDPADRRPLPLDRLPTHLVDAVLAVEDQRFFEHWGLDPPRIAAALAANLRALRTVQGASTITQQLARTLWLDRERTLARKLRESLLALRLERTHSKRAILEAYLNEIYLGQRGSVEVRGVASAARHYFGRDAEDLDLAESALLAGLIRGPSLYSPFRYPERARERRDLVLSLMRERGRIDDVAYKEAVTAPLRLRPRRQALRSARWFTDGIRETLVRELGRERVEEGGLAIHTTLDVRLQRLAARAVASGLTRLEKRRPALRDAADPLQGALVALAPSSGEVLALVGGRDYARSQFDRATRARRQPGSVFKPIVALAALSRGEEGVPALTLASRLEDAPLLVETREGDWTPANHDGEFRGDVTLRTAIEQSLNVPMARAGLEVGLRRVVRTARRLGLRGRLAPVPSLALGAFEVTLLEMTRAYAVLAAEGVLPEVHTTTAVLGPEGTRLLQSAPDRQRRFNAAETYLVTSALEGAIERGTGRGLRAYGVRGSVAGKTGSTNDYRDAWFIGYTPEIVVGVWVGFDDARSLALPGASAALPIFAEFLHSAFPRGAPADFRVPPGIDSEFVNAETGLLAGAGCDGEPELFLAGTAPQERCLDPWLFAARERLEQRRPWRTERRRNERARPPQRDPVVTILERVLPWKWLSERSRGGRRR